LSTQGETPIGSESIGVSDLQTLEWIHESAIKPDVAHLTGSAATLRHLYHTII